MGTVINNNQKSEPTFYKKEEDLES